MSNLAQFAPDPSIAKSVLGNSDNIPLLRVATGNAKAIGMNGIIPGSFFLYNPKPELCVRVGKFGTHPDGKRGGSVETITTLYRQTAMMFQDDKLVAKVHDPTEREWKDIQDYHFQKREFKTRGKSAKIGIEFLMAISKDQINFDLLQEASRSDIDDLYPDEYIAVIMGFFNYAHRSAPIIEQGVPIGSQLRMMSKLYPTAGNEWWECREWEVIGPPSDKADKFLEDEVSSFRNTKQGEVIDSNNAPFER